jgi:hypothetical protein
LPSVPDVSEVACYFKIYVQTEYYYIQVELWCCKCRQISVHASLKRTLYCLSEACSLDSDMVAWVQSHTLDHSDYNSPCESAAVHSPRYITLVATMAPHKLRMAAVLMTVVVVWKMLTIDPIHMERMNWARNTMLLTIATSVPSPRSCVSHLASPSLVISNYNKKFKI